MDELEKVWRTLPRDRLQKALSICDFMLGDARHIPDPNDTLAALSTRLIEAGVPLDRCTSAVGLLHAEHHAVSRIWERERGVRDIAFSFGEESQRGYRRSPMAAAHERREWIVLWLPDTDDGAFDIVPQLKSEGYAHYICAPVFLANNMANAFTFATKSPDGFSEEDIAVLRAVFPALAACQEILVTHRILREVMRMYVGTEPHRRILSGDVHRGEVLRIRSAILFADMRGFTALTADMSAEQATELLNAYYDCVVPPIEQGGGEVLKFIGDGVLAIFRAETEGQEACKRALEAARAAIDAVKARKSGADISFDIGIALHFGEAAYGNVGSGARLDYTVIGRDVNLASRMADMCGTLERPLLVSEAFAERIPSVAMESRGDHTLKGFADPQEILEPAS